MDKQQKKVKKAQPTFTQPSNKKKVQKAEEQQIEDEEIPIQKPKQFQTKIDKKNANKAQAKSKQQAKMIQKEEESDDSEDGIVLNTGLSKQTKTVGKGKPQFQSKKKAQQPINEDSDNDDSDEEEEEIQPQQKGKGQQKQNMMIENESDDDDDDEDENDEDNDDNEESDEKDEEDSDSNKKPAPKPKMAAASSSSKTYEAKIFGLSYQATKQDIESFLSDFTEDIISLNLLTRPDGSSKGLAFAKLSSQEGLDALIEQNGVEHMGRTLQIQQAIPRGEMQQQQQQQQSQNSNVETKTIFVGNLSYNTDENSLAAAFAHIGEIESCRIAYDRDSGRSRGFGHIDFTSEETAKSALSLQGAEIDGRNVKVDLSQPRNNQAGGNRQSFGRDRRGGRGGRGGDRRGGRGGDRRGGGGRRGGGNFQKRF